MIVGVDPGVTGAVAFLYDSGEAQLFDIPVRQRFGGKYRQIDAQELAGLFLAFHVPPLAYVEEVHAMPKQGVTSTFGLGQSAGIIEGVLAALDIVVIHSKPQIWKKHFNLIRAEKDASRLLAIRLYPKLATQLSRKKDHGRAEALLIARYGQDMEHEESNNGET